MAKKKRSQATKKTSTTSWVFLGLCVGLVIFPRLTVLVACLMGIGLAVYLLHPSRLRFDVRDLDDPSGVDVEL